MSKKTIWISALIAMLTLATVAGTALASGQGAPWGHPGGHGEGRRGARGQGEVIAIADDEFTLLMRDEVEITVQVDEDTRYFGDLESFNDIEVGMTVAVAGIRKGEETGLAKAIGAGEQPFGLGARGEVTDVDADSLTIETRDGESLTFQVDGETVFLSRDDEVQSLADIEIGYRAGVHYEEASDGTLLAKTIGAGEPKGDGPPADSQDS